MLREREKDHDPPGFRQSPRAVRTKNIRTPGLYRNRLSMPYQVRSQSRENDFFESVAPGLRQSPPGGYRPKKIRNQGIYPNRLRMPYQVRSYNRENDFFKSIGQSQSRYSRIHRKFRFDQLSNGSRNSSRCHSGPSVQSAEF
jgi:hypothetical protein